MVTIMAEEDKSPGYPSTYKLHRKGWGRSKCDVVLATNTSSIWSYNTSSTLSVDSSKNLKAEAKKFTESYSNPTSPSKPNDLFKECHDCMTSSSSIMSSSLLSNDNMTSSHGNGPTTDSFSFDEHVTTFPLRLHSLSKLADRTTDDDETEETILRNVRHKKKSNSRSLHLKQKNKINPVIATYCSSPYPSSVTSWSENEESSDSLSDDVTARDFQEANYKYNFHNACRNDTRNISQSIPNSVQENSIAKHRIFSNDEVTVPSSFFDDLEEYRNDVFDEKSPPYPFPSFIPEKYRLLFNICGKTYEVDSRIVECYPNTLLGNPRKRMKYYDRPRREYFMDRHRATFEVILDFYSNGGLLIRPDDIPIDIFMNELKYYTFDHSTLEQFLKDEGILYVPKYKPLPKGKIRKFIWELFEDHESSCLSMVITILSALIISISVVVFCLESLTEFESLSNHVTISIQPAVTSCQASFCNETISDSLPNVGDNINDFSSAHQQSIADKHESKNDEKIEVNSRPILDLYPMNFLTKQLVNTLKKCNRCKNLSLQYRYTLERCLVEFYDLQKSLPGLYNLTRIPYDDINTKPPPPTTSINQQKTSNSQDITMNTVERSSKISGIQSIQKIKENVTQSMDQSHKFIALRQICPLLDDRSTKSPYEWFILEANLRAPAGILFLTETCCIVWFMAELGLRFLCCPDRKKFAKSFLNVIDALAILPYFITLVITTIETKTHLKPQTATILRTIRLVRMLRILKLSRYSRGFRILGSTLARSTRVLFLLVCFQVVLAVLFSSIVYFMECDAPNTQFQSIPDSFWWAIITMTTVGYGDLVPVTPLGKICGACCAIMGILSISFPVPVIVSNFNYLYNLDKDDCKLLPEDLMEDEEESNRSDEEEEVQRNTSVDKFQENLFFAMKKSASDLGHLSHIKRNPAELWNIARKRYYTMSTLSIDAKLSDAPLSTQQDLSPLKRVTSFQYSTHAPASATNV